MASDGSKKVRIGVLALQGSFAEHCTHVTRAGGEAVEVGPPINALCCGVPCGISVLGGGVGGGGVVGGSGVFLCTHPPLRLNYLAVASSLKTTSELIP